MVCFATRNVVSVAEYCDDETLRKEIELSDKIRNETLNRCYAIPSYKYKSLKWKNKYYDHIREVVKAELMNQA